MNVKPAEAHKLIQGWGTKLLCRNASVADFNVVLCAILGCNNAPYLLGAEQAAKAAMFYMVKYVTKDSVALNASLSVLVDAWDHIKKYPSIHPDAASNQQRNAIHLMQRTLNQIPAELADTQAAALCLDHAAELCSESFVPASAHQLLLLARILEQTPLADMPTEWDELSKALIVECATLDSEDDSSDEDEDGLGPDDGVPDHLRKGRGEADQPMDTTSRSRHKPGHQDASVIEAFGYAPLYEVEQGQPKVAVPPALHYVCRAPQLQQFGYLELLACYEFKKLRSTSEDSTHNDGDIHAGVDENRGRKSNAEYHLCAPHPLHGVYGWVARSKLVVPKLAWRPPTQPKVLGEGGRASALWKTKYATFAAYMNANFVPWTTPECGSEGHVDAIHPPALSPAALLAWIYELQVRAWMQPSDGASSPALELQQTIAAGRLRRINNFTHTLSTNSMAKSLLAKHRGRNVDYFDVVNDTTPGRPLDAADQKSVDRVNKLRALLEGRMVNDKHVRDANKTEAFILSAIHSLRCTC